MFLNNPYNNYSPGNDFGYSPVIPQNITNYYNSQRANKPFSHYNTQFYPQVPLPATITKAGESLNIPPKPLPSELVGIKFPQYSTASHALIENERNGVQLGMPDVYKDNPHDKWTYGIQYYTIYKGNNPKNEITPILYPQAYRKEVWAADTVFPPQVNQSDYQDITDLEIDYSCRKGCPVPSASLGTPVPTKPLVPGGQLDVQPIGKYPNIGEYTAREIGRNSRSYPQPVNPIVEIQKRKYGLPPTLILSDFMNEYTKEIVQSGFKIV